MTLNGETSIIPCEDSHDVPMVQCDFVSIADLESREKDTILGENIFPLASAIGIINNLHFNN